MKKTKLLLILITIILFIAIIITNKKIFATEIQIDIVKKDSTRANNKCKID